MTSNCGKEYCRKFDDFTTIDIKGGLQHTNHAAYASSEITRINGDHKKKDNLSV